MQFVNLGKTGLKVSKLCLGMMTYGNPAWRDWVLNEEASRPFVKQALDAGVNFFDTADMYSDGESEIVTGRAMKELVKREDVVIATKVYNPMGKGPNDRGLSRKHILAGIDASLRRLGMDYVDLYQIHRWDYDTPIEETMDALNDVVRSGKARYLGASSMFAWQFSKALYTSRAHGWSEFVSMQNHYNLVYREEEREMIPLCIDQGVGLIPWSPLARGFLAGNRKPGEQKGDTTRARSDEFAHRLYYQPADFQIVERLTQIAQKRGVPNAQVALSWIAHKPGVTAPIVGASKPKHLEDAIAGVALTLSPDETRQLEEPYQVHPVLGHS